MFRALREGNIQCRPRCEKLPRCFIKVFCPREMSHPTSSPPFIGNVRRFFYHDECRCTGSVTRFAWLRRSDTPDDDDDKWNKLYEESSEEGRNHAETLSPSGNRKKGKERSTCCRDLRGEGKWDDTTCPTNKQLLTSCEKISNYHIHIHMLCLSLSFSSCWNSHGSVEANKTEWKIIVWRKGHFYSSNWDIEM